MAFVMFYRDEATLSIPKKVSHNIVILIKNAFAILIQRRFFYFLNTDVLLRILVLSRSA